MNGWVKVQNYYEQKKFKKALECYSHALKQEPDNVKGWANKGMANYKLTHHEEAIDDINHALDLDPQYLRGYYLKAFPLGELKRYPEAIKNFDISRSMQDQNLKKNWNLLKKIWKTFVNF